MKKVLENRKIKSGLESYQQERENLCMSRLKMSKSVKTPPWELSPLLIVLKQLKWGRSRDPLQLAKDIFHPNVAGCDLLGAILKLMNRIKEYQVLQIQGPTGPSF